MTSYRSFPRKHAHPYVCTRALGQDPSGLTSWRDWFNCVHVMHVRMTKRTHAAIGNCSRVHAARSSLLSSRTAGRTDVRISGGTSSSSSSSSSPSSGRTGVFPLSVSWPRAGRVAVHLRANLWKRYAPAQNRTLFRTGGVVIIVWKMFRCHVVHPCNSHGYVHVGIVQIFIVIIIIILLYCASQHNTEWCVRVSRTNYLYLLGTT